MIKCPQCSGKLKEVQRQRVGAHIVAEVKCQSCRMSFYPQWEIHDNPVEEYVVTVPSVKPKVAKGPAKGSKDKKGLFLALWRAFAPEGMPEPVYSPEHRFNAPLSGHRFDFAWPEHKVAVEVDGGQFMVTYNAKGQARAGGRHNTDTDRHKMNIAARLGWLTFRYTPQMLNKEGEQVVLDVCEALRLRSKAL